MQDMPDAAMWPNLSLSAPIKSSSCQTNILSHRVFPVVFLFPPISILLNTEHCETASPSALPPAPPPVYSLIRLKAEKPVMSLDSSLKGKSALERHRNVLKRAERIEILEDNEKWAEEKGSVFGLVKVAHRKAAAGKKAAKAEATEAGATAAAVPTAGASGGAAPGTKAPAAAGKAPAADAKAAAPAAKGKK
jgi:small basic protein (TIGR04137 family)